MHSEEYIYIYYIYASKWEKHHGKNNLHQEIHGKPGCFFLWEERRQFDFVCFFPVWFTYWRSCRERKTLFLKNNNRILNMFFYRFGLRTPVAGLTLRPFRVVSYCNNYTASCSYVNKSAKREHVLLYTTCRVRDVCSNYNFPPCYVIDRSG